MSIPTVSAPPTPVAAPTPPAPTGPAVPVPTPSRHDADLDDILSRLGEENWEPNSATATSTAVPRTAVVPGGSAPLTDPRDLTRPSSASGIVVEVGSGLEFDPTFATFGQRAVGAIVDTLVVNLAMLPGLAILLLGSGTALALIAAFVASIGFVLVVVLAARSIASDGKWIGNRVAGTTVVDGINGSFIDQGRAGLRMIGRHVISPILLVGYIVAFADGQRRTFHDRLAGTVVIRRPREVWSVDDS